MGVVTASILQDGNLIEPDFELLSIDIRREYNRIPYAELTYIDGDPSTQEFPLTDSDFFAAGNEIEIRLRYEGDAAGEKTVFKGVVIRQAIQLSGGGCILNVELSDPAVRLTAARKSQVYENQKDSDIISALIKEPLKTGTIDATKVTHPRIVQYYTSDWDFILCRAEANGLLVSSNDGLISAQVPKIAATADHTFRFGIDEIYGFDLEADSRHQHQAVESASWDVKNQQLTEPVKGEAFDLPQAKLKDAGVYAVLGQSTEQLVIGVELANDEAQAWATARLQKDRLAMLRGNIRIDGKNGYELGQIAELIGMSELFTGMAIITGIRHQVDESGWYTWLQFGLSPETFATRYPVTDPKAAGLIPGVNGLQIGIVEELADPDNEFRVKVKIPALGAEAPGIWARLSSVYAGEERGLFVLPEPGDEVVLGFLNDDPRQAILLGSMYSSALPAPLTPTAENEVKGFVMRNGLKLLFDDAKQQIRLSTSDDQQIVIDEKQQSIEIKDVSGNSIKLADSGITLASAKDLILKAEGNVQIESGAKVEIKGSEVTVI